MEKGIIYVYFNRTKYEKEGIEKYYVGQTVKAMEQRAGKNGRGYGALDETCNNKFANSIRKWGWDAFECRVLEEVYEEDLDELEKFYIEQFDSYENGYNMTRGGEGTRGYNAFASKTEEEMKEIKKNMSIGVKKRYKDPKEREKTGEASKTYWKNPERRKKQSEAMKSYLEDPEVRKKCGKPGEKHVNAKNVYCNELNIIFSYVKLAEKYCINVLNSKIGPIGLVCNGKRKSTGKLTDGTKLTWSWAEDVDQEILDKAEYIDSKRYEEILSQNVNVCNK